MPQPYPYLPGYAAPVPLADPSMTISAYSAGVDRTDPRLRALMAQAPAIGVHDHPFLLPADLNAETWGRWREAKRLEYAYEAMRSSGVTAAVASTNSWHTAQEIETMLVRFLADLDRHEGFHLVRRFQDIERGRSATGDLPSSLGIILALESMTEFAHDLDAVERLYGMGVRVAGMIYSDGNILGGGLSSAHDEGLTSLGRSFVARMNALGMVPDFAHAGDRTTFDAIEVSEKPILVSHAGSRSLWPTSRMKPDDLVIALAQSGGVIGIEAPPNSTCVLGRTGHDIDQVMAHVEHVIEIAGIDAVVLGLDVVFGPHHQLHGIRAQGSVTGTSPVDGRESARFVDGVENPEEAFWNVGWWLMEHGYADEDILKILGGNALAYFRRVLP